VKYVAVVEGDIDEASGAAEKINLSDVRLVTAEIRRVAVKNLSRNEYDVITSETVMAQSGSVLEECADENCVITLGSKIGADYIVRATVSKLESMLTLQVDMYETNDGNLVASSDPVRSYSVGELVENAAAVCANMFKTWAASQKNPSNNDSDGRKLNDFYFAFKSYTMAGYGLYGLSADFAILTGNGVLHRIDIGIGSGISKNTSWSGKYRSLDYGICYSSGREMRFGNDLQFILGASVGLWSGQSATRYDSPITVHDGWPSAAYEVKDYTDYAGLFVMVHWHAIELEYRMLVGVAGSLYYNSSDQLIDNPAEPGATHQISIGYCFGKRSK